MGKLGVILGLAAVAALIYALAWFISRFGFFELLAWLFIIVVLLFLLLALAAVLRSRRSSHG